MKLNLLTIKEESLFFTEKEAYDHIEQEKNDSTVISASVKYRKPTKKTREGWIVTIQYFYKDPKELLSEEPEGEQWA